MYFRIGGWSALLAFGVRVTILMNFIIDLGAKMFLL